jgi:hypothetical protein
MVLVVEVLRVLAARVLCVHRDLALRDVAPVTAGVLAVRRCGLHRDAEHQDEEHHRSGDDPCRRAPSRTTHFDPFGAPCC